MSEDVLVPESYREARAYHDRDPDDPERPGCNLGRRGDHEWRSVSIEEARDHGLDYCRGCDPAIDSEPEPPSVTLASRISERDPEDLGLPPRGERNVTTTGD